MQSEPNKVLSSKPKNGKQPKLQIDITYNMQHRETHQKGKYEVHQCGFDVKSESLRTTRLAVMSTAVGCGTPG